MKVKTILVSQPEPANENSPYTRLKDKHNLKIDFRPFIHVEGVDAKDVRRQKIDFADYSCVILTSRNSVDHFFQALFSTPDHHSTAQDSPASSPISSSSTSPVHQPIAVSRARRQVKPVSRYGQNVMLP